ncbi:MAG: L,D-transpeptidase [Myxococcota bacterium]
MYKHIPNGSMLSYGRAFEMHGRVWLVSSDLTLVPADRVQVIQESAFEGVDLMARGLELPLGWNRTKKPQSIYRRNENGAFVASGETLAAKQWVAVVDRRVGSPEDAYFELRERPGFFLRAATTTLSRKRKQPPRAIKPGEKWIDAHINPGTLTAYVGDRPVYATLFSPGKGGVPVPGLDHTKYATTQTGYFRYEWKERVATMSNEKGDPRVLWFSDVPRIQYIRAPLAMHVAYWHADFANPKSAECVNISARDGKFLFEWTDPKVPEEWGAVRPGGGFGKSTPIMINGVWVD